MNKITSIRQITYCAILCALLCVSAFISIPIPLMPIEFTLQTIIIIVIGSLLDRKHVVFTIATYILLGLIGLPVFSAGGGLSYIFTPSFGYLIGFLLGAVALSSIYRSNISKNKLVRFIIGSLVCVALIYIVGVSYMMMIINLYMKSSMQIADAIYRGALIFIPLDIVKCAIAYPIVIALEKVTNKV